MESFRILLNDGFFQDLHLNFMSSEICSPSCSSKPFVRFHYTLCLTLKGNGSAIWGKEHHFLRTGQGILIPPDAVVSFSAEGEMFWEYLLVGFSGKRTGALLNAAGLAPGTLFSCSNKTALEEAVKNIAASSKGSFDQILLRQALLCTLFSLLAPVSPVNSSKDCFGEEADSDFLKSAQKKCRASVPRITAAREDRPLRHIEKALEYVSLHYASSLSVAEMAAALGISRNYLFTLFQKNLGCSPFEYITAFRLSRGKDLLLQTDYSIGSIAYSCGYEDPAVFSKAFKKKYGINPSALQKRVER